MEKKGVPINNFFTIFEKALFQRGVEIILTVRRGERQRAMECGCGVFRAGRKGGGYRQGRSSVVRKPRQKDFAERSRVRRSFTKAQASRPWIPVALSLLSPFARLIRHPTTAARQCEPRDVLAATHAAASRPERNRTPRATPSTLFRKERRFVFPEKENEPFTFETVRGMPAPLSEPSR